MEKTCITAVFLCFITLYAGAASAAADASYDTGFCGIFWGEDLSARNDMRRISCDDSFCSYVRSMEDLSMGEALLDSVTCHGIRGRFVEVVLEAPVETVPGKPSCPQSENFLAFKKICHERFGKTSFAASFESIRADQYRWEYTNIRKILKVNFNRNHMELTITDHDLLTQLKDGSEAIPSKSGENAAESRTDAGEDLSGGSDAEEAGNNATSSGMKKTGKFLKWLFVNDNPEDNSGQPGIK